MKTTLTLELTRAARSQGGDRYECQLTENAKPMVIYLPQSISRTETGTPAESVRMEITT